MPITPSASLGHVGWVRFGSDITGMYVRATSCDVKATQAITRPDVVDGKIDKTVYQLGPVEVGGTVAFPAVYELYGTSLEAPSVYLWNRAFGRADTGEMQQQYHFDLFVKYVSDLGFRYTDCVVDTYEWSITQGDVLNISVGVIGIDRTADGFTEYTNYTLPSYNNRNTRIITWNDITVEILDNTNDSLVESKEIRAFTASVANNTQRWYALNSSLAPVLVAPTKREITGTIEIMGRSTDLGGQAYDQGNADNQSRCKADSTIRFGYNRSNMPVGCGSDWFANFYQMCVFEIETIGITNELFATTINWHALPGVRYGGVGGDPADENFVEDTTWP